MFLKSLIITLSLIIVSQTYAADMSSYSCQQLSELKQEKETVMGRIRTSIASLRYQLGKLYYCFMTDDPSCIPGLNYGEHYRRSRNLYYKNLAAGHKERLKISEVEEEIALRKCQ